MIAARSADHQNQNSSALSISCISPGSSAGKHPLLRQLTTRLWYRFIAWQTWLKESVDRCAIIVSVYPCGFGSPTGHQLARWSSSCRSSAASWRPGWISTARTIRQIRKNSNWSNRRSLMRRDSRKMMTSVKLRKQTVPFFKSISVGFRVKQR